jgi:predicted RNA binding protein YcfA (HicA-like mRNA interferase family)
MPKLKNIGGPDVVNIFSRFGFIRASQRGSHIKLTRISPEGSKQSLTIPLHKELDKGTLIAIFRQGLKYISEKELRAYFYSD